MSTAKTIVSDINWKQLAISTVIAFIVCLLASLALQYVKELYLPYWFDNIFDKKSDDYEQVLTSYFNSYYWYPGYILVCLFTQLVASLYLAKRTPNKELTNGLALGIICIVFVYQFDPFLSFFGVIFSLATCYMVKQNRIKLTKTT